MQVVFSDWKRLHLGCPLTDFSFLVISCTCHSVRSRNESEILSCYLKTFKEAARKAGVSDIEKKFANFGLEELRKEFHEATVGAFYQVRKETNVT